MYNKTNVNSKCSMRVIKGCTGRTTYGQSAPRSCHQPAPGIRPRNPDTMGQALQRQNKSALKMSFH